MTFNQARAYSSPAQPSALNASITAGATTLVIASNPASLNWPPTPNGTSAPNYTLLLDWGSPVNQGSPGAAEVVLVTNVAANTPSAGLYTLTITRGQDGTTGAAHSPPSSGYNVYHGVSEQDFGDAAAHLGSTGQTTSAVTGNVVPVHGIASSSAVVGLNETQTLTNKTLTSGTNTFPTFNQDTTGSSGSCTGNSATATTAAACSGNSATATLAANSTAVDGVTPSGTPAAGLALIATSGAAATWEQALSGVYDVTKYGVTMTIGATPPSGAVQTANVNALIALCGSSGTAAAGSVIYFPPGVCYLNAVIGTLGQAYNFRGCYGQTSIAMTVATAGTWLTTTTNGASPTSFDGLMFYSSGVNQTVGATIEFGSSLQPIVRNCQWNGGGGTNHLFNCLSFNGGASANSFGGANGAVIDSCNFGAYAGTAITVTSCISSHAISNCLITGGYSGPGTAACGIEETNSASMLTGGSAQITNCDIIGNTNNVLITSVSGGTMASVFMNQCFMDQAVGSNLLITGAGTVARCRFVSCWFTLATSSSSQSAVVVNTSGSSTHAGLEWNGCWVLNTPAGGGTANGFLISAVSDFTIDGCQIAGWTGSGVSITPVASSGITKPTVVNNIIGPVGLVGANTTGVTLAASTNYGTVQISNNNMSGNTTPYAQGTIAVVAGSQFLFSNNSGVAQSAVLTAAQTSPATTAVTPVTGFTSFLPIGVYSVVCHMPYFPEGTVGSTHTHTFTFTGTATGNIVGSSTQVAIVAAAGSATFTAAVTSNTHVAADFGLMVVTLGLIVTAAGTLTLNVTNTTAADTVQLQVGCSMTVTKAL